MVELFCKSPFVRGTKLPKAIKVKSKFTFPEPELWAGCCGILRITWGRKTWHLSACWFICAHAKMSKQSSIVVAVLEWGMYWCRALTFVLNCFIVFSFLGLTHGSIRVFCILVGFLWKAAEGKGQWIVSGNGRQPEMDLAVQISICPSPAGKQHNGSKTYFPLICFSMPLYQDKLYNSKYQIKALHKRQPLLYPGAWCAAQ